MESKFLSKSSITDLDYFRKVLLDCDLLTVKVRWGFDEQQADGFHHNFNSHEFVRRLSRMVKEKE